MKKVICTVLAAALMLCSCGSSAPDPLKDYKDFWDYTFDGEYTIKEVPEESSDTEKVWDVGFTDLKGEKQTEQLKMNVIKGDDELAERECSWAVLKFIVDRQSDAVNDELYEKLLSKHFECTRSEDNPRVYTGEGLRIEVAQDMCDLYGAEDSIVQADLDPDNGGIYYNGTTLKNWAAQKVNGLTVNIYIDDSTQVEDYMNRLTEFGSEYTEYTADPQNYCFTLSAPDVNGNVMPAAAGCRVLGEEADAMQYSARYIMEKLGRNVDDVYDVQK